MEEGAAARPASVPSPAGDESRLGCVRGASRRRARCCGLPSKNGRQKRRHVAATPSANASLDPASAPRAKDAAANAAKHDPKLAGLLTAGGALLSETKKKFEESRGALMLSTFDKLEPKLAGFMLHVYATKIKPGLTTDKWMPESMRSDTRSNCQARQACY